MSEIIEEDTQKEILEYYEAKKNKIELLAA